MDTMLILAAAVTGLAVLGGALIGGGLSLLGTQLSNRHQYSMQRNERRRDRLDKRLAEVRRYVTAALGLADLACGPSLLGVQELQGAYYGCLDPAGHGAGGEDWMATGEWV